VTHHHAGGPDVLAVLGVVVGLLALLAYGALVLQARRRGRLWPAERSLAWAAGSVLAAVAVSAPLASRSTMGGPAHMVGHLLLGMLAPLLLVLGAPVTLALRGLPVAAARRLTRLLRTRPLRFLTEPAVAAVLDVAGLWLLYATPLMDVAQSQPVLDVVVHLHVLLAGCLFTAVLVGPDPLPHRRGTWHRLVVLALALAAHDVLAKWLYARASADATGTDTQQGAMVMYYGGDAVELTLAVLLCARWDRRARPRLVVAPHPS
jgi:putative membrane protein